MAFFSFGQQRGGQPVQSAVGTPQSPDGNTYAVVVGISDYQHPDIPDLKYAVNDAEAFANFLRSPAGGSVPEAHMRLLTGEHATMAQVAIALDWLMEIAGAGDLVYIYFSGHGDVERKTVTQPGYLLCWDAPAQVYLAGGAFNVRDMKDIVSTLTGQNNAKVVLITDACRSGKLSGSSIGGTQATAMNLMQQFSNEVKILSCQPNEYSIEGAQWGEGRGAFSYHLINGLYGLADRNGDLSVDLMEMQRYLQDRVTGEVAPLKQIPVTVGDYSRVLTTVDPDLLARLHEEEDLRVPTFAAVEHKGIEEQVLEEVDTSILKTYRKFKTALEERRFLNPPEDCAEYYYQKLLASEEIRPLHSVMRRTYAAALQDDAQQVMNKWLESNRSELDITIEEKRNRYGGYPSYLQKAAELLGEDHYMYPMLMARKHFWRSYVMTLEHRRADSILGKKILVELGQAKKYYAGLPFVDLLKGMVYTIYLKNIDSTLIYANRAIESNPSWILPYTVTAMNLCYINDPWAADSFIARAEKVDTHNYYLFLAKGFSLSLQGKFDQARPCYEAAYQIDSTTHFINSQIANFYIRQNEFLKAEKYVNKALQIDSVDVGLLHSRGYIYYLKKQWDQSEKIYKRAIILFPGYDFAGYFQLATVAVGRNDIDQAYQFLEESLKRGMTAYMDHVRTDPDINEMRADKERWEALMDKYSSTTRE